MTCTVPVSAPFNCPILQETARIDALSKDMVNALRRLRRNLPACADCARHQACPIRDNLSASVQAAIQSIIDEWDLTAVLP